MAVKNRTWDPAEYPEKPEERIAHLNVAFENGDSILFQAALGDVVRSRGIAEIAREAGVSRGTLYRLLFEDDDPSLQTIMKVLAALGLELEVKDSATE